MRHLLHTLPQLLYDTFSAFGVIVSTPKIMRDPETGNSRGFGFVSFDCFEVCVQSSLEWAAPCTKLLAVLQGFI